MIRFLLFLLLLTALGAAAAWFAGHPGDVTIHWFDYRIDTSFAFLLLVALTAAAIVTYTGLLLYRLTQIPVHFSERRTLRHHQQGLVELTYSVAALAAADPKTAELHTRKAEKLLGRTPLTLLLSAQVARSRGDDEKTRLLLEQMLNHKETEYLAARSLSDSASKEHLYPKALSLAQRAQAINAGATEAVVSLHLRLGQWQEALAATAKSVRKGSLTRTQMKRLNGMVYLMQGQQLLDMGQSDGALYAAKLALKNLPDFTPALQFAARAYDAAGKKRKADKLRATFPRSLSWSCASCGHGSALWEAHCPSCDAFDTLH